MFLFSIPDSHAIRVCNGILLAIKEQHPKWLNPDCAIDTVYGCPPHCIWNGNRSVGGLQYDCREWAEHVLARYYYHKITYRLTFTNFLVQPEHLQDEYGNAIAATVNFFGGSVMVATQLMAEYMGHYPNLKVCWSTTTDFGQTPEEELKTINRLSAGHLVVLPYMMNNTDYLKKLQHPENIEVLVNEQCINNCPRRREHWTRVNTETLNAKTTVFSPDYTDCFFPKQYDDPCLPRSHTISKEMLKNYTDLGINHFKISGRLSEWQTWTAYMNYLFHPNYMDQIQKFTAGYVAWANGQRQRPPQ